MLKIVLEYLDMDIKRHYSAMLSKIFNTEDLTSVKLVRVSKDFDKRTGEEALHLSLVKEKATVSFFFRKV